MTDTLNERLNRILPRITADAFLSGSGLGNKIAFYLFDYPPEAELRVRDYLHTLPDHLARQRPELRVRHVNLFDFVLDDLKYRNLLDKAIRMQRDQGDAALKKALAGPLHESRIGALFAAVAQPDQHDLIMPPVGVWRCFTSATPTTKRTTSGIRVNNHFLIMVNFWTSLMVRDRLVGE